MFFFSIVPFGFLDVLVVSWQAVGKELRVDFVGSYAQLLEQGRLTRLPRRRRRSGNGAPEGEEMEEDGEREVLMGKLWENYGKTMGKLWENYGKTCEIWRTVDKYGKTLEKNWTSSWVPWFAYKTWRFSLIFHCHVKLPGSIHMKLGRNRESTGEYESDIFVDLEEAFGFGSKMGRLKHLNGNFDGGIFF